jgi:hypothetical protein
VGIGGALAKFFEGLLIAAMSALLVFGAAVFLADGLNASLNLEISAHHISS